MDDVRNRLKLEFVKNTDEKKILIYQSRVGLNGIHKSYDHYDRKTFGKKFIKIVKPINLGFVISELSKLIIYETFYDKLQKYKNTLHMLVFNYSFKILIASL